MFTWFLTLLQGQQAPSGDQALEDTIAQMRTCRGHLALLMEEARLARQLLGVTLQEIEGERARQQQALQDLVPMTFTTDHRQRGV